MKPLTTYEKIFLGCVAVLVCVLGFYFGDMVYKWVKQSWAVKEPPQIGSSVQAYPAKIVTEWEKQVEPIGNKKAGYLGISERVIPPVVEVYPEGVRVQVPKEKKESPEDYIGALLEKYPPPPIKIYSEHSKSIIIEGSLKIIVGGFPYRYIQIYVANKYGEEMVYPRYTTDGWDEKGGRWRYVGKWQEDFYSFARKVKKEVDDKYAKREEEARQKTKKVLEAYK